MLLDGIQRLLQVLQGQVIDIPVNNTLGAIYVFLNNFLLLVTAILEGTIDLFPNTNSLL